MSKTLKLDTLKGFKPSGVNVDKSIIDSALKEFSEAKSIHAKTESPDAGDSASSQKSHLQTVKDNYEKRIALLEKKVKIAESQDKSLSRNEEKLLIAIRSEKINQVINEPIISRNMLIKKYCINSKYLDESIKGLEVKKVIERKEIPYSSKIMTNSWKLL
jgi:hypothetical protein